jgi:hypothetical protein
LLDLFEAHRWALHALVWILLALTWLTSAGDFLELT